MLSPAEEKIKDPSNINRYQLNSDPDANHNKSARRKIASANKEVSDILRKDASIQHMVNKPSIQNKESNKEMGDESMKKMKTTTTTNHSNDAQLIENYNHFGSPAFPPPSDPTSIPLATPITHSIQSTVAMPFVQAQVQTQVQAQQAQSQAQAQATPSMHGIDQLCLPVHIPQTPIMNSGHHQSMVATRNNVINTNNINNINNMNNNFTTMSSSVNHSTINPKFQFTTQIGTNTRQTSNRSDSSGQTYNYPVRSDYEMESTEDESYLRQQRSQRRLGHSRFNITHLSQSTRNLRVRFTDIDSEDLKFTRQKWTSQAGEHLRHTGKLLDNLCKTLVRTSDKFDICPSEMRELSFTVGVVERKLNSYIKNVVKYESRLFSHFRVWRHPGGMISLLEILHGVLDETQECLTKIEDIANINDFITKHKMICGIVSLFAIIYILFAPLKMFIRNFLIYFGKFTNFGVNNVNKLLILLIGNSGNTNIHNSSNTYSEKFKNVSANASKSIQKISGGQSTHPGKFITNLRAVLNPYLIRYMNILEKYTNTLQQNSFIEKLTLWISRFRLLILPSIVYLSHRLFLRYHLIKLSKLRQKLTLLILNWEYCMTAITDVNRLDISFEHREQKKLLINNCKDIEIWRWTLRKVSPSAHVDACFWYSSNFRLSLLKRFMDTVYATTRTYYNLFGGSTRLAILGVPFFCYYTLYSQRAALRGNEFLAEPDIKIIRLFHNTFDSSWARWLVLTVLPKFGLMAKLKTVKTIELETDLRYQSCSIKKIHDKIVAANDHNSDDSSSSSSSDIPTFDDSFVINNNKNNPDSSNSNSITRNSSENSVSVDSSSRDSSVSNGLKSIRLVVFSAAELEFKHSDGNSTSNINNNIGMAMANNSGIIQQHPRYSKYLSASNISYRSIDSPFSQETTTGTRTAATNIIFYIHGGGFMSTFYSSDLRIVSKLSKMTDAAIVEVDYSLMPNRWPTALEECIFAYKALCKGKIGLNNSLNNGRIGGGCKMQRITVLADSNGCSLAVSMILGLIEEGDFDNVTIPDSLILCSPVLSLRDYPTSSRLLFMMDPLVPMKLTDQIRKYYLKSSMSNEEHDYFISPLVSAPDRLLSLFPNTNIIVGSFDPYLDDAVDFAHRLNNVNVNVQLKICKQLPHALLMFNYGLPNVSTAMHIIAKWIKEAFGN